MTKDLKIYFTVLLLSLFFYFYSLMAKIPPGSTIDSMTWPRMILYVAMFFSVVSIIGETVKIRRRKRKGITANANKKVRMNLRDTIKFAIPVGTSFLYIFSMYYLGFFLSTLIFIPAMMYILRERKIKPMIFTPIILLFFVWLIFIKLGTVVFPEGVGVFKIFSEIIMYKL